MLAGRLTNKNREYFMKKAWWIKKTYSFKEAEKTDDEYYRKESFAKRLNDMQLCREQYFMIEGIDINESRKRLRRVFRVIKQK
jgi:hypothetical protein